MSKASSFIDSASKVIAALVAAGGFIWGIIEFQDRQLYNETYEYRMRLWERKLDVYTQLQDITGYIIINRTNPEKLDSLELEFSRLYYTGMVMVEDSAVEESVVAFREALADFRKGIKKDSFLKKKQIGMMRAMASSIKQKQELLFDEAR